MSEILKLHKGDYKCLQLVSHSDSPWEITFRLVKLIDTPIDNLRLPLNREATEQDKLDYQFDEKGKIAWQEMHKAIRSGYGKVLIDTDTIPDWFITKVVQKIVDHNDYVDANRSWSRYVPESWHLHDTEDKKTMVLFQSHKTCCQRPKQTTDAPPDK